MNRFTLYAAAALVFLGALFATVDKGQINAMRTAVGLAPLHRSEAQELSAEALAAEMERLKALPVPGIVEGPSQGEAAAGVVDCAAKVVGRPPQKAAAEGARRYLLALALLGLDAEAPLIEPRLRPLHPVLAIGPMAVLHEARQGRLSAGTLALLGRWHQAYSDPEHPLYKGIGLHGGTFEALDFEALTTALAERWQAVADCAEGAVLPPMAEWHRVNGG